MQLATSLWEASRSKRQCDPDYKPQIKKLRDFYEKIFDSRSQETMGRSLEIG